MIVGGGELLAGYDLRIIAKRSEGQRNKVVFQ